MVFISHTLCAIYCRCAEHDNICVCVIVNTEVIVIYIISVCIKVIYSNLTLLCLIIYYL